MIVLKKGSVSYCKKKKKKKWGFSRCRRPKASALQAYLKPGVNGALAGRIQCAFCIPASSLDECGVSV